MYNKCLDHQLLDHFGALHKVPANFGPILRVISDSYDRYERAHEMSENLPDVVLKRQNEENTSSLREKSVTERKKFENIIAVERKQFRDLFLQAPSCMGVLKGPTHIFELANTLYLQLIGKDDIIGKTVKEVLPEIAAQGFIGLLDDVYQTGIPYSANEMLIKLDKRGNGEFVDTYLNFIYQAYRNSEGEIEGILFFAIDVTEQVLSRKKIEESELSYRSIFEQASDAICILDGSMRLCGLNPSGCKMLGYSTEEFEQLSMADFLFIEDLATNPLRFDDLKSGKAIRNERRFKRKDGMPVLMEVSTIMMADGRFIMFGHDISKRKKAETILKENEAQLSIASQIAKLGYWEYDVTKNQFTFNDQFYSIFKTSVEKIGGYTMTPQRYSELFVHPDDAPMVGKEVADAINSPDPHYSRQVEHRIIYGDGEVGHMAVRFFIVKNEQGVTIKTFGANQDITERKTAEEALSDNELRFRTLTESAPVGIFQTDTAGKTTYVNKSWLGYTGMSYEETMGDGWIAAIHPADREIMIEEWSKRSKQGVESHSEYRLINKNGKIRWVMGRAVPISNINGNIVGHIGTVSDVTERKLAIESLQQSETKYRQIVETAQEGIWLIDENNYTVFVNKKMAGMLEYSPEEIMGKQNYYFMDDEWKEKGAADITRRKLGINETHEFKYITKNGKDVWTSLSTNPVFDDAGIYRGALAMVTDITQRRQDEAFLKQSKINLAEKNKELEEKNKELGEFAYVTSHDLQEPLRTTASFVELLQEHYADQLDGKANKYLTYILQSTDRMKILISDLLEYSRIGNKRELQEFDCNSVWQEVIDDLCKMIQDTGAVLSAEQLPVITGYRTEFKQLFQNLVVNALKFRKKDSIPQVGISAHMNAAGWTFTVRDNGIGIAEEQKDRIFVIFQRLHTRTEYEGSGIGLAHCKKIVGLHGGKIWVESTPGEGAAFLFNIPQNVNK